MKKMEEKRILAELERERSNQHQMFIHALNELKSAEEKKIQMKNSEFERTVISEKIIIKRNFENELSKELKKPVEDMMLTDHKPLPVFNRIPGLKLAGKAFSDALMVFEFLYNFGETINFDLESLPSLNSFIMALLNLDKEAEEELMSILVHLVVCAIEDPGMPNNVTTCMGQKLKDATVTVHNVTEIMCLYFRAFDSIVPEDVRPSHVECRIYDRLCEGVPYLAMNADVKLDILVFLCNELLCNQAIVKQIDDNIESVNTIKKDRWQIENDMRKYRLVKMKRERLQEIEQAKQLCKENAENTEDKVDSDNEETNQTSTTTVSNTPNPELDFDLEMTNEELDKKIEKLNKQSNQMNNKLNKALNSYRIFPLGQDRYRRTYWVLPNVGGVFVEGMESAEPSELENNLFSELELIALANVKKENIDIENGEDGNGLSLGCNGIIDHNNDLFNLANLPDDKNSKPVKEENNGEAETKSLKSESNVKSDEDEDFEASCGNWFDILTDPPQEEGEVKKEEDDDDEDLDEESLEHCLANFLDETTIQCLFSNTDKNADALILKETLLKILEMYPRSAAVTVLPHKDMSLLDLNVCPNLQKRIQIWKMSQRDGPVRIPRDYQLGWWRITDPNTVKSVLDSLHTNAQREKNLQKQLYKHLNYAMQSCKSTVANLEVDDYDTLISETRQFGAPVSNQCIHKPCHSKGYCIDVAFNSNLQVLEQIEAFEEKILSCSMQIPNWQPSSKSSSFDFIQFKEAIRQKASTKEKKPKKYKVAEYDLYSVEQCQSFESSDSEDDEDLVLNMDLLNVQREKLLDIEPVIERRYLKPPLGFKNNATMLLSSTANADTPNGEEYNEYATDDNATAGLLRWREAVRDAYSCSQLAMCLHFLENCIAWDKSVMRAVS